MSVAEKAAHVCDAYHAAIILVGEPNQLRIGAQYLQTPDALATANTSETFVLDRNTVMGRAVVDGVAVQVNDLQNPPGRDFERGRQLALRLGHRTTLAVPLLRGSQALGSILLRRKEVRPFSRKQIALLGTFADQAAIAIENARLFNETKEGLLQQTAISEILRVISNSPTDVQPVLDVVAQRAAEICEASDARIFLVREGRVLHVAGFGSVPVTINVGEAMPLDRSTIAGRAIVDRTEVHIEDMSEVSPTEFSLGHEIQRRSGYRTALAVPMLHEDRASGSILIRRMEVRPFSEKQIALLKTFANQAAIAIDNVRLFHELQEKNAQVEAVSRHKSEFLANMSHELRTPLNAILGFSEVLGERYFGELNDKQDEYVKDIRGSGEHLLSLINDILDLSKVEAGKMELELSEFDLTAALKNVVTLVKERAQRHGITVSVNLASGLDAIRADERKLKQIMLNLLSNAVKFTPDGGAITVVAKQVGQMVEIAVSDTGAGIAPEDLPTVFEEFKQVGSDSARKAEGTGLGLPLAKKFVELHGGEIRVESEPGAGSTFTVLLPSG
jgi:signal transduction histidine kinase